MNGAIEKKSLNLLGKAHKKVLTGSHARLHQVVEGAAAKKIYVGGAVKLISTNIVYVASTEVLCST